MSDTRTARPDQRIVTSTGEWEVVIGVEVHAQITSTTKLFSGTSTKFGEEPNSNVSLFDAGIPGTLPSLNRECVCQAVRTGLGLNSKINLYSVFERKHYFYPDLPKGYQISQRSQPIVGNGSIPLDMGDGDPIEVGIERVNLEQDAGKLLHDQEHDTLVDLNRAGVALMEIVSTPSLRSAEETKAYLSKLRAILRCLGTCDGDMEKGSMRADVNVSVRRPGGEFGTRCEIKNLNSIKFVGQAIEHEAARQIALLESGGVVQQDTLLFDNNTGKTRVMRSKHTVLDYRYFPDPDLPALQLDEEFVEKLKRNLPELPDAKKLRFIEEYGVSPYDAMVLTLESETADYYEAAVKADGGSRDAKMVAHWITGDLASYANKSDLRIWQTSVTPTQLAGIVDLISDGTISGKIGKEVLALLLTSEYLGYSPHKLVEDLQMSQITDVSMVERAVESVIAAQPDKVAKVKTKPALISWFVGQVLKETKGKANPKLVNEILTKRLGA